MQTNKTDIKLSRARLEAESLLSQGIAAVKGGNYNHARRLLVDAARNLPNDARPWLWLSATTTDMTERYDLLSRAIVADPYDPAARRALALLNQERENTSKPDAEQVLQEGEIPSRQVEQIKDAAALAFRCSRCGGSQHFSISEQTLQCTNCGDLRQMEMVYVTDTDKQSVDRAMFTRRAHAWATNQNRITCQQCGAISLTGPGWQTDQCMYCGSYRMVLSPDTIEILEPQGISILRIDSEMAQDLVRRWLKTGHLAPDDLALKSHGLELRPGYYPFWLFDGTVEVPWSCEVNMGSNRSPRWVHSRGLEFKLFDNVVVPGMERFTVKDFLALSPFNLHDALEFAPEYLAGWVAMNYDYPFSDATLTARERVMKDFQSEVYRRVEPGREKRKLMTGAGNWSDMTYKLILLPLWVGVYSFQGKSFRVLVNGQTGKVVGEKPVDRLKVALVALLAAAVLAIAVGLGYLLGIAGGFF